MRPRLTFDPKACLPTPTVAVDPPPKLIVIVVVDQMRADYIDRFEGNWSRGLKRLVKDGACSQGFHHIWTVTCAAPATTGACRTLASPPTNGGTATPAGMVPKIRA
jgi:hypothetical protein